VKLPLLLVLSLVVASAQHGDLEQLLAEALAANPEVLAAQKRYEAARQRPTQSSSLPDPVFSPSFNSNGRPWPGAALGTEPTSNIGFMVSQEIPFPGKRKLAGDLAAKDAEAAWQQYLQVKLSLVSRLKQAWFRRAWAFAASDVLRRNLDLLDKFLRLTEARYAVGKAAQQDVFKAQTQISILETKRIQLEREKQARAAEINSLLNRRPGSPLADPPPLKPTPLPPQVEELFAAARANNPLLRRDEKLIQRAETSVNMARRNYYPDFTLNGGYYNMGRMPDMYMFRADFKVPLYFFRKQRAAVTEQAQSLAESRRAFEATNQSLHYRIQDDYLMAQTAQQLIDLYSRTVIPQAELTLDSSLRSYETGAVDFLSVFQNFITIVEYEMNYQEELQNLHLALARLEETTAQPLVH
jgi:outer membrane protein TolC